MWQVLPLLTDYGDVVAAVRSYLCALFTVYVAQGTPELQLHRMSESAERSLPSVVHQVMSGSMQKDEHMFKLIQVCSDMYAETVDPALRNIYSWAASTALSHPLSFR